eukprot:gnl/TRDRNA2_/TRDRNA2_168569_c4_seq1.p1 gnl/TRDRNA2_/TRDRNA2_168569_c4~~gnl/TRDRNA2_/TRDRNA2_168569_c4_seq1.p1  ORF type:complete len:795 (+),score=156.93 gnl/TRDRNA2_/TRDRNA2_168569_c4_seq1:81-2465(+)
MVAAPFFTTRTGSMLVSYEPRNRFQSRSRTELSDDPRARFKERYGSPQQAFNAGEGAVIHNDYDHLRRENQELLFQLAEAHAEIQHLRSALKVSYPQIAAPVVDSRESSGIERSEEESRAIADLEAQLFDRDQEVLQAKRRTAKFERLTARNRQIIQGVFGRLLGQSPDQVVLRGVWDVWRQLQRERHEAKQVLKGMTGARAALKPAIMRAIESFSSQDKRARKHVVFTGWMTFAHEQHIQKMRQAHRTERIQATLLQWGSSNSVTTRCVCWSAWRSYISEIQKERHAVEVQKDQQRAMKEMRRQASERAIMAMQPTSEKLDPVVHGVILGAWRRLAIETRADAAIEARQAMEREQQKASAERHEAQSRRKAVFLLCSGPQGHAARLASLFLTWKDFVYGNREEQAAARFRLLRTAWAVWRAETATGHEHRELDKIRKDLEIEQKAQRLARGGIMGFAGSQDPTAEGSGWLLKATVWSAWQEAVKEEAQRKLWEQEWQEKQEEQLANKRRRSLAVAFSAADRQSQLNVQLLLTAVWSAWLEYLRESRRTLGLDAGQRIFESEKEQELQELKAEQKEAEQLGREAMASESRHHVEHQQRRLMLLMSQDAETDRMLLKVCWSAWRERVKDGKEEEMQVLGGRLPHSGGHARRRRCFACCWPCRRRTAEHAASWEDASKALGVLPKDAGGAGESSAEKGARPSTRRAQLVTCPKGHVLKPVGMEDSGWACDARREPGGCKHGITDFYQTEQVEKFHCDVCDYDLCGACYIARRLAPRPSFAHRWSRNSRTASVAPSS